MERSISIYTVSDAVASVARRHREQYQGYDPDDCLADGRSIVEIQAAIEEAGNDKEAIDAAIGNDSWTTVTCDVCDETVSAVVQFNTGEWRPADICEKCLAQAKTLLRSVDQ